MSEAFIYFSIIGMGLATGFSIIGFISYFLFSKFKARQEKKSTKINKRGAF